jgi:hypothetical protein
MEVYKAFNLSAQVNLQDSNYDLLQAIHFELNRSHNSWKGVHIKGHQDDIIAFDKLDRPSQLNFLVDQMAKEFLLLTKDRPREYKVHTPAWFLWIEDAPLIKDIGKTIYDLVHTPAIKKHWIGKLRISASFPHLTHVIIVCHAYMSGQT